MYVYIFEWLMCIAMVTEVLVVGALFTFNNHNIE